MAGVPLNIPSYLFQAIENLALNTSARYVDTFLSKDIEVSNKSTLIAEIPINEHTYLTRIRNNSDEIITLSLGKKINKNLTDDNAIGPFTIQPKSTFSTENIKGKLYAVAPNNVILKISILSEIIESSEENNMVVPLILKPRFGAGESSIENDFIEDIDYFDGNMKWGFIYVLRAKKEFSGPGHWTLQLKQFTAGQEYTLKFDFNPGYESSGDESMTFNVYLIDSFSVMQAIFVCGTVIQSQYVDASERERLPRKLGTKTKNGNLIKSFPSGKHEMTFTPSNDSMFLHVAMADSDNYEYGCIITNYDEVNQEITIGAY